MYLYVSMSFIYLIQYIILKYAFYEFNLMSYYTYITSVQCNE